MSSRTGDSRLDPALQKLARRIMRQRWNRPGTDKTWVPRSHFAYLLFFRDVKAARDGKSR